MRKKLFHKSPQKIGLPPGSLVHVGKKRVEKPKISLIDYDSANFIEREIESPEDCLSFFATSSVTWVNVDGLHEVKILERLGAGFDLHPLVLEDILNTGHRPKLEDYDSMLFLVLKALSYEEETGEIIPEQVSLVLGPTFVLTFQEWETGIFDGVRTRIRSHKGRVRSAGPDYLAYALLDAIVDNYYLVLGKISDQIDTLEEELLSEPTPATLNKLYHFKREMVLLRKVAWPLREIIASLQRSESSLVEEKTRVFLRDIFDHAFHVVDTVETFRDLLSGMLDLYLSQTSNRTNEVMKVLTIVATIFIPLTFIAGIYGMNFENMPELKWQWGYPTVWLLMAVAAIGMLLYFRKRRWF